MSEHTKEYYEKGCEFTVPIKLNIPVTVCPQVYVVPVNPAHEKLPIFLEPDVLLEPEVKSKKPICKPVDTCKH
ncbi:MAG: hypothetical protein QNJ49_09885 [Mastigocoleus sp. MO_167.B18]|nr:hypothetical protein [Mastigocoleus sp. MO_167.B18]